MNIDNVTVGGYSRLRCSGRYASVFYLAMTRGQDSLLMELEAAEPLDAATALALREVKLTVVTATAEELEAHAQQLEMIERESRGKCIWKRLEPVAQTAGPEIG